MQKGKKNLSNWQQNIFHMKCDAADASKGAKGAPEEDGKDKCCSRGPCNKLGGLGWREGRGRTPLQTLSAAAPGPLLCSSPPQSDMRRPSKDFTEEERIAIFIINFGNGLPGFRCAWGRSAQLS